jgi:hypothetical protein
MEIVFREMRSAVNILGYLLEEVNSVVLVVSSTGEYFGSFCVDINNRLVG